MKRFNARAVLSAVAWAAACLTQSAWAGFLAPSYAGQVNSTSSVWNYNGDWYTGDSASHLVSFSHVDGPYLLDQSNHGSGCVPGVPCLLDRVQGAPLDFYIPNYVDELPNKYLRIQYRFVLSDLGEAGVEVTGFDPAVGSALGELLRSEVRTDAFETNGVFYSYMLQDWRIRPNPNFEHISISNANGAELSELRIDTISIPEPLGLALALSALAAAGLARRRR